MKPVVELHGLSGIDVEEMNGWMVSRTKGV